MLVAEMIIKMFVKKVGHSFSIYLVDICKAAILAIIIDYNQQTRALILHY